MLQLLAEGTTIEALQEALGWRNRASVTAQVYRVDRWGYSWAREGDTWSLVLPDGVAEIAIA